MEHSLREELRPSLIFKQLKASIQSKKVTLWQSQGGQKICVPASLIKFPYGKNIIKFFPRKNFIFQFNSTLPIYFYEKNLSVIFKSQVCYQTPYEIEVLIPEKILLEEGRLAPRDEYFMLGKKMGFHLEHKNKTHFENLLLDLGPEGASFRVHKREYNHFYVGDKVQEIKLPIEFGAHPSSAEIIHISSLILGEKVSPHAFKVGIRFKMP